MALITLHYNYVGPTADVLDDLIPDGATIVRAVPSQGIDVQVSATAQDDLDAVMARLGLARGPAVMAPMWAKYTKTFADFSAASFTNDVELFSLPAGGLIHVIAIKAQVAFGGTGITGYTVSVGVTSNMQKYATAFDVFQVVCDQVGQVSNVFGLENFGAVTSIRIQAVSSGAFLNLASAGSVDVWVLTSTLP